MTSRLRRKHQIIAWSRRNEIGRSPGSRSPGSRNPEKPWGKIAWLATLAAAVVFQTVAAPFLAAAERSVLVKPAVKSAAKSSKPLDSGAARSEQSGSKQVKLKWRKRQPKRGHAKPSPSEVARSQVVTASGETSSADQPRLVASEAITKSRIRAPRYLPTADFTPTVPLRGPRVQFAQETRSPKDSASGDERAPRQPSIDELFNDLPNDPPSATPDQPEPTPEFDPEPSQPRVDDAPPPDDRPALTDEQKAEKCRDDAKIRNQEINGTSDGKQQGAIKYCEEARREFNTDEHRVVNLSIDISPPKPAGGFKCDRDWKDITGKTLLRGRPDDYDVIAGTVTIKSPDGKLHKLQIDELGLADRKHFLAMYRLPMDCAIIGQGRLAGPRNWAPSTFTWTASALCSKPLYFEEIHLERYGHSPGPILGPIVSSAHFFGTFPILPYKMGLVPPNECVYTLGYYRPGNCAPYLLDPIPLSVRAGLWQAGAWVGGVFLVP